MRTMSINILILNILLEIPSLLGGWILKACATSCEKQDIGSDSNCNLRGGLKCAFYAKEDEIDWDTMEASFDAVTCSITDFVMMGGGIFCSLKFSKKTGTYNFTYTRDADVYEQLITMVFEGKAAANAKAICQLIGCCDLILALFDNNCTGRVVGKEWDGEGFDDPVEGVKIVRHLDAAGEFGGDKPRDEIDFGGESTCTPVFLDLSKADFEAAVT